MFSSFEFKINKYSASPAKSIKRKIPFVRRKAPSNSYPPPIQHINATEKINPSKKHNKNTSSPLKYINKKTTAPISTITTSKTTFYTKNFYQQDVNKIYLTKYSIFQYLHINIKRQSIKPQIKTKEIRHQSHAI
jgi:hypothetical protein